MVSCLYEGHYYDLYKAHSADISLSHQNFSDYNNWDYLVLGDEINDIYGLASWKDTWIDARCDCLGMNKWYAINWVFENFDYDSILMVDFDSKFLKNEYLDLGNSDLKFTKLSWSPYYDSVWFLYYCLYKGVSFETLSAAPPFKYNTGFFKINRGLFSRHDLDDYVDFACKTLSQVRYGQERNSWIHMSNADMARIQEIQNTTLTPFDEVFAVYHLMTKTPAYEFFDDRYNVNNAALVNENSVHVHFCTNKEHDIKYFCRSGIANFIDG